MAILLDGTNIKLFEPQDRFSRLELNSNFQGISDLLLEHKALIENRARIASGSYAGAKGSEKESYTDFYGNKFTAPFYGVTAGTDRTITLPFKPLLLILTGEQTAAVNWSGTGKDANGNAAATSLSGKAYRWFRQIVCAGQSVGGYQYVSKTPKYSYTGTVSMGLVWYKAASGMGVDYGYPAESEAWNEVTENEDGTWSVVLKAVQHNDILGMTYQWVAMG